MLPLRDVNPTRQTPFVNLALIGICVAAFAWQLGQPGAESLAAALVPAELSRAPIAEAPTLVTSMFLHGSLGHVAGNLWFLRIFGDNVEEALGHRRYLAFYLLGGLAAGVAQLLSDPGSPVPVVGASGAIAAVTAAYVVLHPRAPVVVLNPVLPLWLLLGVTFVVPAWMIAAEFFVMNLVLGAETLGQAAVGAARQGGVAVFAHLGGFVAGLALLALLRPDRRGGGAGRRGVARGEPFQGFRPRRR